MYNIYNKSGGIAERDRKWMIGSSHVWMSDVLLTLILCTIFVCYHPKFHYFVFVVSDKEEIKSMHIHVS